MAKKLIPPVAPVITSGGAPAAEDPEPSPDASLLDYDLVGDVVFEPPLPPEELRRRFGYGVPIEERIEQARRQNADGCAWD